MTKEIAVQTEISIQSPWRRALVRFRRHKLAVIGTIIFGMLIFSSIFAPFISRYRPNSMDLTAIFTPPSAKHWLGTDGIGRDVWARIIYGGRISITVGVLAVAISTSIAIFLGGLSGYFGGKFDLIVMRLTDIVMSIPPLVLIMALVAVVGPSLKNTILAIGILGWPTLARLVRGQFLTIREQDYITAARALGLSNSRIIFRHLLPNSMAPIIVAITLQMASAILTEAALSFLGIGVPPPTPSWGNMLQDAQTITILAQYPWMWLPPGFFIVICVLSVNFIGDGLRDAMDPHLTI